MADPVIETAFGGTVRGVYAGVGPNDIGYVRLSVAFDDPSNGALTMDSAIFVVPAIDVAIGSRVRLLVVERRPADLEYR